MIVIVMDFEYYFDCYCDFFGHYNCYFFVIVVLIDIDNLMVIA